MKALTNVCAKFAYTKRIFALTAMNRIRALKNRNKYPCAVYKCSMCNYWHLTSKGQSHYE
jgi:hypothetical protein